MKIGRHHGIGRSVLSALLVALALSTAACGVPAADQAAPGAIAMADTPQAITPQQFQEQFAAAGAPYQLVDVRTAEEFDSGHIAGAVNIPVEELAQRLAEVNKERSVVVYCRSGRRSAQAASILQDAGYTGIYDLGGVQAWQEAGLPLE